MDNFKRRISRYQRRQRKRYLKLVDRNSELGSIEDIFTYRRLWLCGKECCKGVRWKQSVQNFERHMFSITAKSRRNVVDGTWKPKPYFKFTINERGKTRDIEAPAIADRQILKVLTRYYLMPIYKPYLIYDNGASLQGKGLCFSYKCFKLELVKAYKKYGLDFKVMVVDLSKFFPNAPHDTLKNRHNILMLDDRMRKITDMCEFQHNREKGLPIGVEPSLIEMVSILSKVDSNINCLHQSSLGHYMDDYHILSANSDVLDSFVQLLEERGFRSNKNKTLVTNPSKYFKFCKKKFKLTNTGKVIVKGNVGSYYRAKRKLKKMKIMYDKNEISLIEIHNSFNGSLAHMKRHGCHYMCYELLNLFFDLFGFSFHDKKHFGFRCK